MLSCTVIYSPITCCGYVYLFDNCVGFLQGSFAENLQFLLDALKSGKSYFLIEIILHNINVMICYFRHQSYKS